MLCLEELIGSISSQIPSGDKTGSFPRFDPGGPVLQPLQPGEGLLDSWWRALDHSLWWWSGTPALVISSSLRGWFLSQSQRSVWQELGLALAVGREFSAPFERMYGASCLIGAFFPGLGAIWRGPTTGYPAPGRGSQLTPLIRAGGVKTKASE